MILLEKISGIKEKGESISHIMEREDASEEIPQEIDILSPCCKSRHPLLPEPLSPSPKHMKVKSRKFTLSSKPSHAIHINSFTPGSSEIRSIPTTPGSAGGSRRVLEKSTHMSTKEILLELPPEIIKHKKSQFGKEADFASMVSTISKEEDYPSQIHNIQSAKNIKEGIKKTESNAMTAADSDLKVSSNTKVSGE